MHTRLLIAAVLLTTACGDDATGPGDKVDPSDVKPADLYGYWITLPHEAGQTILGFLPAERAARELAGEPELPPLPGADTGGVWVGDGSTLAQLTEFRCARAASTRRCWPTSARCPAPST